MKKLLVLGLCCGVAALAVAETNKAQIGTARKASVASKGKSSVVAPAVHAANGMTASKVDLGVRPGSSEAETLYRYLKGMEQPIPADLVRQVFPTQGQGSAERTGGDTYALATPIAFSPGGTYNDSGTTAGAVNNYDAELLAPVLCNTSYYTSSFGGPDVVYSFTLPASYEVSVSTCNNAIYDSCLGIVDSNGSLVAVNDDGSGCTSFSSQIAACCLDAGTYYIVVDGYGNVSGDYIIDVTFGATPCAVVDPCDEFSNTNITLPYTGTGSNVGAPDILGSDAGDVGYTFTLTETSAVTFESCLPGTNYDADSYLYLGDPCDGGTQLLYNDGLFSCTYAAYASGWFVDCGVLTAGTYTLVMSGYSTAEGNYEFNISAASCACPPVPCAGTAEVEPNDGPNGDPVFFGTINTGETVCGTTFTQGDTLRDTDWYEILLANDGILTLAVDPSSFDAQILILGADAATILYSANAAGYCADEMLTTDCLQAGIYYAFVSHTGFTGVDTPANYALSLSFEACTYVSPCDAAVEISCGGTYTGDTTGDLNYVGNASPDNFFVFNNAVDGAVVTFTMCAVAGYDTYLRVYDGCPTDVGTTELYFNDDFCGLQSQIDAVLASGTYYVLVEGFGSGAGPYQLDVTCATCDPITCTGTDENEAGGNDGPNADPVLYGSIACGETVCGTTFTFNDGVNDTRDLDWFELVLANDAIVTVDLNVSSFNGILFLVAGDEATILASADAAGYCADETLVSDCLQAGTYYVVAGHNDFTGVDTPAAYGLTVTCEACTWVDPYTACQTPSLDTDPWNAGTSELDVQGTQYLRAERFGGVTGAISAVDFNGLPLFLSGSWATCAEDPMPFTITFYDGSLAPVATFTPTLSGVAGTLYAGAYQSYDYHYDLPAPLFLTEGYMSIQGAGSNSCWFLWMSSSTGADAASLLSTDGGAWAADTFDLNYCFTTVAAPCDPVADLTITKSGPNVVLNWTAAAGATAYNVYESADAYTLGALVATVPATTTSFTIAGAKKFYTVKSVCP